MPDDRSDPAATAASPSETSRRLPWLAILLPGCVAIWCYWRTVVDGGFLSDDFMLGVLHEWDAAGQSTGADWGRVFADFARPWFGLAAPLYRPMLSVSFGLDVELFGAQPAGYHASNLLLHVLAVLATAVIAAVLGRRAGFAGRAALLCGSIAALHPACVESVAWIAARNSGIEVAFRNVALACFAMGLVAAPDSRGRRRWRIATLGFAVIAFACKESAVMLVPAALAIDVLHSPSRPWRERLRLHVPLWIVLGVYLAWRTVLFGEPFGSPGGHAAESDKLAAVFDKLAAVVWPSSGELALRSTGAIAWLAVYAALIVAAVRSRYAAIALGVGAVWLTLSMLPTHALPMFAEFSGSRMVLDGVHAWSLVLAAILFGVKPRLGPRGTPRWRGFATIALVGAAVALLAPTLARLQRFDTAWSDVDEAIAAIGLYGAAATEDAPLALLSMPQVASTPPMNANAWFPLAERPIQPRDIPCVCIGYITLPVPGAEPLHRDPAAARALWSAGAPILYWTDAMRALPGPGALSESSGDVETLAATEDARLFRFAAPKSPLAFDAIRVSFDDADRSSTSNAPRSVGLELCLPDGQPLADAHLAQLPSEFRTFALAPMIGAAGDVPASRAALGAALPHEFGPFVLATLGLAVRGVRVIDGEPSGLRVDVLPNAPRLAATRHMGRRVPNVDALQATLLAPPAAAPLRLVLIAPHAAVPGGAVDEATRRATIPAAALDDLPRILAFSRTRVLRFYFETEPSAIAAGAAPERSPIDWVIVDD